MRYESLGDYWYSSNELRFRIVETGNHSYNRLILIHEMIEEFLTEIRGIKEQDILKFDLQFEKDGKIGEPGNDENAPYRSEHRFAEMIEKMLCHEVGIDWNKYESELNKIFDEKS